MKPELVKFETTMPFCCCVLDSLAERMETDNNSAMAGLILFTALEVAGIVASNKLGELEFAVSCSEKFTIEVPKFIGDLLEDMAEAIGAIPEISPLLPS